METTTIGAKIKRTAGEMAERINEAAHTAGERLSEMREVQRINTRLRALQREKDQCRLTMADLMIRMLDQNTFVDALLRPEYQRIKELDQEMAALKHERHLLTNPDGAPMTDLAAPLSEEE